MSAALQIEPPAKVVRRHGASLSTKPTRAAPHVATKEAKPPRRKANALTEPRTITPSATHSAISEAGIVAELVQLQRMRKHCITAQSRCDRSIESLIATLSGYRVDDDEKARKASFAQAAAYRKRVEKDGGGHVLPDTQIGCAPSGLDFMILANASARAPWDDQRAVHEKEMEMLAKLLPVYPFVESVRGLGAKGFAIIVAEAGIPIGEYRTVSGLWKRLGLAVIGGECQRRKRDKDAAAAHGYSPARRAQVWAVCSDSLFRAQWRGADEDAGLPARPIGPYGEVYARRRAHTAERVVATEGLAAADPAKWTKGRCHNDARRVMTKQLMVDLWVAWRKASGDAPE